MKLSKYAISVLTRKLLRTLGLALAVAWLALLTELTLYAQNSQLRNPRVYPSTIVAGTQQPTVEISGFNAAADAIIQINGRNISTLITRFKTGFSRLTGVVPSSLVAREGTLIAKVVSPSSGISEPLSIIVKRMEQPASLHIATSQRSVRENGQLMLEVLLTNRGNDAFYVPAKINPLLGGNSLSSGYELEVRHPGQQVYTSPILLFGDVGPSYRPTEGELLQSGIIVKLAPAETLARMITIPTVDLEAETGISGASKMAGEYSIRMRFEPRGVPGQNNFGTKFLSEDIFSNSVTVKILNPEKPIKPAKP